MIVNLSHLTGDESAFFEILEGLRSAPMVSHHSCRAVNENTRALSDPAIRAIADAGGVTGVPTGAMWLCGSRRLATVTDWVRHVRHITKLVGVDHAAVGTDHVDVATLPRPLPADTFVVPFHGPEDLGLLYHGLKDAGYSPRDCERILSENVLRVWRAALPKDGGQ